MAYQNYGYHPQQYQGYAYAQQPHPDSYQARIREYEAARIPQHYAPGYNVPPHYARNYDPYSTHSSDYISEPKYTKEDHIAPHLPSARVSRLRDDYDATRYETSDYISPPVENRDDYISPNYDAADLDSSSYDGTDLDSSPEPLYHHSTRERDTEDRYYDPPSPIYHPRSPVQQNSPHRTIKAARFSTKNDSHRTPGSDTWDSDSYDEDSDILDVYSSEDDVLVARAPSPPTALSPPPRVTRAPSPPTRNSNYSHYRSISYDSETYVNDTDDDSAQQIYLSDSDVRSNVMPGGYASSSPEPPRYASPSPQRITGRSVAHASFAAPRRYLSSSSLGNDYTSPVPRRHTSSSSTSTAQKPQPRHSRRRVASSSFSSPGHPSAILPPPRNRSPSPPPSSDSDFEIHGGSDVDSMYTRVRSPSAEPAGGWEVGSEDEGAYVGSDVCSDGVSGSWDY
jgi:hypothetical protein